MGGIYPLFSFPTYYSTVTVFVKTYLSNLLTILFYHPQFLSLLGNAKAIAYVTIIANKVCKTWGGGEGGIRTHGSQGYTRSPGAPDRPLQHLSMNHANGGEGGIRTHAPL